jgi:hypothetical protein
MFLKLIGKSVYQTALIATATTQLMGVNVSSGSGYMTGNSAINREIIVNTTSFDVVKLGGVENVLDSALITNPFEVYVSADGINYMIVKNAEVVAGATANDAVINLNSAECNAVINAQQTPTPAPTPTPTPTPTPAPTPSPDSLAIIAADKLKAEQIKARLKSGDYITDDECVFLILNETVLSVSAMQVIDAGGGYDGLRAIGISDSTALKVLAAYNIKVDMVKYQNEEKLEVLKNNPLLLNSLHDFLLSRNLNLPSFTSYIAVLRSNPAIYAVMKDWSGI